VWSAPQLISLPQTYSPDPTAGPSSKTYGKFARNRKSPLFTSWSDRADAIFLAVSCVVFRFNDVPWQHVLWFALAVLLLDLSILGVCMIARAKLEKQVVTARHEAASRL
jgi:hypothetical protein